MSKAKNKELLRAGAYLLPDAEIPSDTDADTIDARAYGHPALGDRKVVRLTPSNLALGEDTTMNFFGFDEPEVHESVALRARQALGFPEWVLVNDPKNARKALDVAKSLAKNARRARSKPGNAKDAFDAIGDELSKSTPHFLPSYYEEVGRAFLEAGNTNYAATAFGKAREAEKVYALEVDEERRRESFLEFALAGALTNKVMTEYARDLSERHGDERAYEYFFDLALRRTLGGTPPHATMVQQLRKLARAADKKAADEDDRFISETWEAPSLTNAASKFWKTYFKAFARLAKKNAELRGRLLNTFPNPPGENEGFKSEWIDFLRASGALEGVTEPADEIEPEARPAGSAADWLARFMHHDMEARYYWRGTGTPDSVFGLLREMRDRLVADGEPLAFDSQQNWYARPDVNLLDLALELEIPCAPLERHVEFDLGVWAAPREDSEEDGRDLRFVAADGRYDDALDAGVNSVFGDPGFQRAAHGCQGLEVARRRWLEKRVAQLDEGGVPTFIASSNLLSENTTAATYSEFGDAFSKLFELEPHLALQRTLNVGLIDEFAWPAFEEAHAELAAENDDNVWVLTGIPQIILHNQRRAIVIEGANRVLEHDLQLPQGRDPRGLYFSGGDLLVCFYDASWKNVAYWASNPKTHVEISGWPSDSWLAIGLEDGTNIFGSRALLPGDETPAIDIQPLVSDGETIWRRIGWHDDTMLRELDPTTGKLGRESLPSFYEDFIEPNARLDLSSSLLYPVDSKNPEILGAKDALYGWRVRRHEDGTLVAEASDGRTHRGESLPGALVKFPHSDEYRAFNGLDISALDESWTSDNGLGSSRIRRMRYFHCLHQCDWRDPDTSKVMRELGPEQAASLLIAGLVDDIERFPTRHDPMRVASKVIERLAESSGGLSKKTQKTIRDLGLALAKFVALEGARPADDEGTLDSVIEDIFGSSADPELHASISTCVRTHAARLRTFFVDCASSDPEFASDYDPALAVIDGELEAAFRMLPGSGYRYHYGSNETAALDPIVESAAEFLMTGERRAEAEKPSTPVWEYLDRIGLAAFFAVCRGTPSEAREQMLNFVRLYRRLDLGRLRENTRYYPARMDDQAFDLITGSPEMNAFFFEYEGRRYWGTNRNDYRETWFDIVEHAPDGNFAVLPHTQASEDIHVMSEGAWGDEDELDAFLEAADELGPLEYDAEFVETFSKLTGLTSAEASLVWVGMPGMNSWEKNFLEKDLRTEMGLKVNEADAGRESLKRLDGGKVRAFYAAAVPAEPATLWNDPTGAARRFAEVWNQLMGRRVSLDEEVLVDVEKTLVIRTSGRALLAAMAEPESSSIYGRDVACEIRRYEDGGLFVFNEGGGFDTSSLLAAIKGILYLASSLPVGHEVRQQLPSFHATVTERLRNPELLIDLESHYISNNDGTEKMILDRVGGELKSIRGDEYVDDGLIVAFKSNWSVDLYFRPAALLEGATHPLFDHGARTPSMWSGAYLVDFFRRPEMKAMIDRIQDTPAEEGRFENDPRASVPELVETVGKHHDVSENAATLYLQTLALHNPTAKFVKTWNGWSSTVYNKAAAELTERELLVEAKRSRASRKHFIPGGWEALKRPDLPIESWKIPLYELGDGAEAPLGQILPTRPVHELFEAAWQRVTDGDVPGFEG